MNNFMRLKRCRSCILISAFLLPAQVWAETVPEVYTHDNFYTSYQDKPLSFSADENGNFSGVTESGKDFTQVQVTTSVPVRLMKFTIDRVSFYISDHGTIDAKTDIEALSMYLVAKS